MKKKLFDYLKTLGFVVSRLKAYDCLTMGGKRECLVFPKGKLTRSHMIITRHHLVAWGYLTEQEFDREFMNEEVSTKSIGMRKLLILRLEEMRQNEGGFSQSSMRYQNIFTSDKIHISQLDFNACSDEELLQLFEKIIRRYHTQM